MPRYHGKVNTWCSGSVMNSCREFVTTIREANVNAKGRAILLKSKHLVNIKNGFVHGVSHPKMKKYRNINLGLGSSRRKDEDSQEEV